MESEPQALVLDIQRMSTEDGPGIRTTVFLKGCNLHCAWCHNPESILSSPVAVWLKPRCIGCGGCRAACPSGALSMGEAGVTINRAACRACMACAAACPTGAMERKGAPYTLGRLTAELMKDRSYYGAAGGVTVSGGEPLLQHGFVAALFRGLRAQGVRTALDTAACVPFDMLESVLEATDLLLLDIKLIDDGAHRRLTGQSNARILDNARLAADFMQNRGGRIWVRTPVIPGATDSAENIAGIGRFIARDMRGAVERWELCAFNNLCRDKYERLGIDWAYKNDGLKSADDMDMLLAEAQGAFPEPDKVLWTGATRIREA